MPTPTKGRRLGGSPAHQRHMLANLATALFEHGKITTTEAKARRLRPFAERLITFAKRGDLHARRQVLTVVTDKGVVHTLFTEIGPQLRGPRRWLHPDHQDRAAQGRQRPARGHRAGPRGGRGRAAAPPPRPPGAAARPRPRRPGGRPRPTPRTPRRAGRGDRRGRGRAEVTEAAEAGAEAATWPSRGLRPRTTATLKPRTEADAEAGRRGGRGRRRGGAEDKAK